MNAAVRLLVFTGLIFVWAGGCSNSRPLGAAGGSAARARVHPFLLFDRNDTAELAKRKDADPLLAECWGRLTQLAEAEKARRSWAGQLEARALLWQLTGRQELAEAAIAEMLSALERTDPAEYYRTAEFHYHAVPLRALALGWDWLHERMSPAQRAAALPKLERWCRVAYEHANNQWWRDASYNVGAIPAGGWGLLATAIRPDSRDPMIETCYREAVRRIGQNYFPLSWKPSGICWEGPNYAIVGLRYVAPFAEALRRSGGDDLPGASGALRAMEYLTYQWMPAGGCAPIGDNTSYGPRTFAAEYLLGLGRSGDPVGLWTWRQYTSRRALDPLFTYLWYPLSLKPRSPVEASLPTSRYFEVTPNRAGYVFSRTRWDDPEAAFFAFVTRFEKSNHQHYDMNSILLGGFGTLFATHRMLFPYPHEHHGVDFEHNLVVVDGGGWPAHDKSNSAGDDDSIDGLLVGLALGPFADYVRGDAKWSYRDTTVLNDDPAIRAERTCLFLKSGPTPYLLALDDIQYRADDRRYDWHWHAPQLPISGAGTPADPLVIADKAGRCALSFLTPAQPQVTVKPAEGPGGRPSGIQRIAVTQRGSRVRFAALAALEKAGTAPARVQALAVKCENPSAAGAMVHLPDGSSDTIVWQSEEEFLQRGSPLAAGSLESDGLLAMVRLRGGKVVGYVLGEGSYLRWEGKALVEAGGSVCVSADADRGKVFGRRRAREGLPDVKPRIYRLVTPAAGH